MGDLLVVGASTMRPAERKPQILALHALGFRNGQWLGQRHPENEYAVKSEQISIGVSTEFRAQLHLIQFQFTTFRNNPVISKNLKTLK